MLHTAAGPKIDSENEDSEEIPLIILGNGLSISSIWDCLFFWTNSLLSDLCEGPHSISFYKYIPDENGWLVTYSTYFLYDDKSCSIINFYSRKLKVYFSKDSCATGNDLSKESIFFCNKKVVCIMTRKLGEETFLWSSSNHLFPKIVISLGMHQNHFFSLRLIPSFFL